MGLARRASLLALAATAFIVVCGPAGARETGARETGATRRWEGPLRVELKGVDGAQGAARSYTARVLDSRDEPLDGFALDIGALTDNPDLRVKTTPLFPTANPALYTADVRFPASGEWVVVVRVTAPTQMVQLFHESVTGVASPPHDNPARVALRTQSPGFASLYDPYRSLGVEPATATDADHAHDGGVPADGAMPADETAFATGIRVSAQDRTLGTAALNFLQLAGVALWLLSLLSLGYVPAGSASRFRSYAPTLTSVGGAVFVGGAVMGVAHRAPDAFAPVELSRTASGIVFLATLAALSVLVAGALALTVRTRRSDAAVLTARARGAAFMTLAVGLVSFALMQVAVPVA